jgi:proline iminopeptidase
MMPISLYPEVVPYRNGMLPVSNLHTLYFEEVGNPLGYPVVFLHGGPGGGCSPQAGRFFDPNFFRVVLFDQRGSSRSTPYAGLKENTTWDLVEDIEKLRTTLGIERWLVFGGSWGSSLALAYAILHPDRVTRLILRGIFLCRQSELDWLYRDGANHIFPDGWDSFQSYIPLEERGDLLSAYYRRLTSEDEQQRIEAARVWCRWETHASRHDPDWEAINKIEDPHNVLSMARIEAHYFMNKCFLSNDNWYLDNIYKISHIPTCIIQGRYDIICPIRSAWDLVRKLPDADLRIIPDGGHSVRDTSVAAGLIQALEEFKEANLAS